MVYNGNIEKRKEAPMAKYVLHRIGELIVVLLGVSLITFILMHAAGGTTITMIHQNAGTAASAAVIAEEERKLGVDQPMMYQYFSWLGQILHGHMGMSFISDEPVSSLLLEKLPNTLLLAGASLLMTLAISIPLGIVSALYENKTIDTVIRGFSLVAGSIPGFFGAILFIYFFSVKWNLWMPIGYEQGADFIGPAVSLAIPMAGRYTRQVRSLILEEKNKPYTEGARVAGIPGRIIITHYILKSACIPLITLYTISFGSLLGGTVIVESIFMYDGIGKLAADSIMMRDYPVVQAYILWTALMYSLLNLAADLLYAYLDPRIKREH
jgi:peptide/nickel transport system permease protein